MGSAIRRCPVSQRETDVTVVPSSAASAACVRPAASRARRISAPVTCGCYHWSIPLVKAEPIAGSPLGDAGGRAM